MPTFHPRTPLPIHLPTFPSSSNPTPISRQHRASTSPAHNQAKPSKITSHEQKSAPIAAKTTEITPPYAHERTKSARIASREQKRVSIEVENDENMHPFAHRRAKSNEIATREKEAAQTRQPETATLSGKSNPNGVATVTKCGRSSRKPRAPTPQTTAHTRNRCRAVRAGRAQSHARSQAAHLR